MKILIFRPQEYLAPPRRGDDELRLTKNKPRPQSTDNKPRFNHKSYFNVSKPQIGGGVNNRITASGAIPHRSAVRLFIGSDHAGFKLKEQIKEYLIGLKIRYEDLGNQQFDPCDDYPDYARKVAQKVAKTKGKGILICDSGVGVCIAANKIKGIRAANVYNPKMAIKSREHNDTNILCLGQSYISFNQAKKIIKVWLQTRFSRALRHRRRINKIKQIEK